MNRHPSVSAIISIAERAGDHPLKGEMVRLRNAAEALDSVRLNRSPLVTTAAHELNVAKKAKQFRQEAAASFNRAAETYAQELHNIDRRIAEKVNLKADEFAPEIRARFREMSGKQRKELIDALVDGKRGPELAAIVEAPSILTGINDQQRDAYRQRMVEKHAADELRAKEVMGDAFESVNASVSAADKFFKELTDPGRMSEIERADEAASTANDAFKQSLSETA